MATHCGGRGDVHISRLGLLDGDALGVLQLLTDFVSELFRGDRGLRCGNFSLQEHYALPQRPCICGRMNTK